MARHAPVKLAFNTVDPECGSCGKPPIIFVHGITSSKEHWDDITQAVANKTKRKVYAIDSRNHGDSERSDVFNFESNVDDILPFMDSEGIPKAIIVGHSMGGITGIKTSLRCPGRIEKLIVEDMGVQQLPRELIDTLPHFFRLGERALQQVPEGVDGATAKEIVVRFLMDNTPKGGSGGYMKDNPSVKDYPLQLRRTEDGRYMYKTNYIAIENSLKETSGIMKEYVGVYEGPAFFIYGKLSPIKVGDDEPNIRKFFPNAEFLGLENATHGVHTDYPQEFIAAITDFILKE